jgi:hypothetical protein
MYRRRGTKSILNALWNSNSIYGEISVQIQTLADVVEDQSH